MFRSDLRTTFKPPKKKRHTHTRWVKEGKTLTYTDQRQKKIVERQDGTAETWTCLRACSAECVCCRTGFSLVAESESGCASE